MARLHIATRVRRLWGAIWLGLRQLRTERARTILAVLGVTLAVLSVTLLAGVGAGVTETGTELFDQADRDLWVTGGPIELTPGSVGGFRNSVTNAHEVARGMEQHEAVRTAVPMGFQTVYISPDGEEFDTILGSGVPGGGSSVRYTNGSGFSGQDTHYAGGEYDGPMTHEVVVDPETADRYNLSVGDSLYIGGTIGNARRNEFTVVGVSPTFTKFVGTSTVITRLSELQTLTGSAFEDRATLITLDIADSADPAAVRSDLEDDYPAYTIRTNREQFTAILERQAVILAAGASLVILGVLAGAALAMNLLLSVMYGQRTLFAVLRSVGATRGTVVTVAVVQAVTITVFGCALGLLLTYPTATALEALATTVTGYEGLVQVPPYAYAGGAAIGACFAVLGSVVGAWRVSRLAKTAQLIK